MFANVFTKTTRDRFFGLSAAAVSVAVMFLGGMAVYRQIDVSFYYEMPQALLDLMGIPEGGDVAGLAFGAIYGLIGAMTLAGIAISMGSGAIAGEEHQGTLGLLLGNPQSRTQVVVSKAASMVMLLGLGSLFLWGAGLWVPSLLDVDMTGIHVGALVFHMFVNSLFYGFLALAIGAWTGNGTVASGTAVAVRKWMDRLELVVLHSHPHECIDVGRVVHEALPVIQLFNQEFLTGRWCVNELSAIPVF